MKALILMVEDEADLAATLEYNLKQEGFLVRPARNGQDALLGAAQSPLPDLVLLDLMLPDLSGTEVCRRLRQSEATRDIPIIMLTAMADEVDRIVGFELGADDYVTKPYSKRELMLRITAVLRRSETRSKKKAGGCIQFGVLKFDLDAPSVTVAEQPIELTALEFRLILELFNARGRVQTRDHLLETVWGHSPSMETRTVDTHVKRLRQKLLSAGAYIETVRGVGYRFRREAAESNP
ncbi:MAG: DNA-binding response regulator [Rickettsiales bacterium]|nr:DNA-binding response regulator [Rickettsiales bacterium]